MCHGDRSQPRVLLLAVKLNLALQNAPRRRTAQGFVRLIDRSQQLDVGPRVARSEAVPPVDCGFPPATRSVALNQPRHLRPAQTRHLLHVAPQKPSSRLALSGVLLLDQNSLNPTVPLLPILALKPDFLAGRDETPHSFQTQLLCLMHADVQSPACLLLQAHLVLESIPPFRLILYWSSRPREFHPEPLTGPDVSLSTHPARATNLKATAFRPNMRAHPVASWPD